MRPDGRLVLDGDGSTLDDLRPVFVGPPAAAPAAAGVRGGATPAPALGGLAVRFDELHHYEIEVGGGVVTARGGGGRNPAGMDQPRRRRTVVTLHLDCVPPDRSPSCSTS